MGFMFCDLHVSLKNPLSGDIYLLNLSCLYLHDSYISKFEFMNYLFANLLVAWL